MKKVLGIFAVAVLAVTMFTNTNNVTESGDVTLASVTTLASANAEDGFDCATVYAVCDAFSYYPLFNMCMSKNGC